MTYEARETSQRSGAPLEILLVDVAGTAYHLTSADVEQVHGGDTYTPTPLVIFPDDSDGANAGELVFEIPAEHALALALSGSVNLQPAAVTLFKRHRDEAEYLATYLGDTASVDRVAERVRVVCRSLAAQGKQKLPRMLVQRTCANMLYDQLCQLDPTDWDFEGEVASLAGRTIEVTDASTIGDDSYFVGGVVEKDGVIVGFIEAQSGDVLTLLNRTSLVAVTDTVRLLAGCDYTVRTCKVRFDNVRHFVGAHAMPVRNPFTGRGVRP